jgi:nicotinamidase-related amidase
VLLVTYSSETEDGRDLNLLLRARNEQRRRTLGAPSVYPRSAPEARLLPALTPRANELVLNKTSQSPFTTTALDTMLRDLGMDGVVIAGVVTNVCVEATARDAADRGYRTVIAEDGCAAWEPAFHEGTLRSFRKFVGRVATVAELERELVGID